MCKPICTNLDSLSTWTFVSLLLSLPFSHTLFCFYYFSPLSHTTTSSQYLSISLPLSLDTSLISRPFPICRQFLRVSHLIFSRPHLIHLVALPNAVSPHLLLKLVFQVQQRLHSPPPPPPPPFPV